MVNKLKQSELLYQGKLEVLLGPLNSDTELIYTAEFSVGAG